MFLTNILYLHIRPILLFQSLQSIKANMVYFTLQVVSLVFSSHLCFGQDDGPIVETSYGYVEGASEFDLHGLTIHFPLIIYSSHNHVHLQKAVMYTLYTKS